MLRVVTKQILKMLAKMTTTLHGEDDVQIINNNDRISLECIANYWDL